MKALFVTIPELAREIGMHPDTFRPIVHRLNDELHGTLLVGLKEKRVNRDVWEAWRESQREPAKQWRANVDARLQSVEGRVDVLEARRA